MSEKKLTFGEAQPCRKAHTPYESYLEKFGVRPDLPENERLDRFQLLFESAARCARMVSDNWVEFAERSKAKTTIDEFAALYESNVHMLKILRRCKADMGSLSITRFNGASGVFNLCSQKLDEEEIRLREGRTQLENFAKTHKNRLQPATKARLEQALQQ